jgi:hypothetical protein
MKKLLILAMVMAVTTVATASQKTLQVSLSGDNDRLIETVIVTQGLEKGYEIITSPQKGEVIALQIRGEIKTQDGDAMGQIFFARASAFIQIFTDQKLVKQLTVEVKDGGNTPERAKQRAIKTLSKEIGNELQGII